MANDVAREEMIRELREVRAEDGIFHGELFFLCTEPTCPAQSIDATAREQGSRRLRMLPKCPFCGRELHYAGMKVK